MFSFKPRWNSEHLLPFGVAAFIALDPLKKGRWGRWIFYLNYSQKSPSNGRYTENSVLKNSYIIPEGTIRLQGGNNVFSSFYFNVGVLKRKKSNSNCCLREATKRHPKAYILSSFLSSIFLQDVTVTCSWGFRRLHDGSAADWVGRGNAYHPQRAHRHVRHAHRRPLPWLLRWELFHRCGEEGNLSIEFAAIFWQTKSTRKPKQLTAAVLFLFAGLTNTVCHVRRHAALTSKRYLCSRLLFV